MEFKCFRTSKTKVLAKRRSRADRHTAAARGIVTEKHVDVIIDTAIVIELPVFIEGGQVIRVRLLVRGHSPRAPNLILKKKKIIYLLKNKIKIKINLQRQCRHISW